MRRCVCGRSRTFPLCDGNHVSTGWSCAVQEKITIERCFIAGGNYVSLAEKLAHHYNAVSAHSQEDRISCDELIILCDGTNLDRIHKEMSRIQYQKQRLLVIGVPIEVVRKAFPDSDVQQSVSDDFSILWIECKRALEAPKNMDGNQSQTYQSIFVSHAVEDEAVLLPIVDYIRAYFEVDLFLCTDSILSGSNWYQTIVENLERAEKVLAINSASFGRSTFCAFEIGMARSQNKQLSIINLDSSPVPAHMQDIQSQFLDRVRKNKPWLTVKEALSEVFLRELEYSK
jgi:hypothetical protein